MKDSYVYIMQQDAPHKDKEIFFHKQVIEMFSSTNIPSKEGCGVDSRWGEWISQLT
jgi:hypothetical protein